MRKSQSCKNEVWCNGARIQAKDLENSASEVRKDKTKRGRDYHEVRIERSGQDQAGPSRARKGV